MSSVLRTLLVPIALVLVAAGVAGCNGTIAAIEPALRSGNSDDAKADGRRMIGKPYRVGGRWFHPKEDENYDKTGYASWYGPGFHGKSTANGERFNQHALTAAHPTLPLPSFVRVTVVDTGKSAVLRLNDRGPFKRGRIIDVSKAAAEKLAFKNRGTAKVRVEYLGPAPVGGGDRETRMAAAEFGENSEQGGLRRFIPFGRGKEDKGEEDQREPEVRVAANEPARAAPVRAASATKTARRNAPETQATAVTASTSSVATPDSSVAAYRAAEEPAPESGAIDALITLNGEPEADGKRKRRPLQAAPLPASEERIMGAHEMFAAIDDASGGAGELRGAGQ